MNVSWLEISSLRRFELAFFNRINGVGLEAHQICLDENDLAILRISKFEEVKDLLMFKNDKICSSPSLLEKNDIEVNEPLYLLAYCSMV